MCKNVADENYLNGRIKKEIHAFQWEILWVKFLEVESILRIGKDLSFWIL